MTGFLLIDIVFDSASGQVQGVVVPGIKKIMRKRLCNKGLTAKSE